MAEFDPVQQSAFAKEQLSIEIPKRLKELLYVGEVSGYQFKDEWYSRLARKLILTVLRMADDLSATTSRDDLPATAWNARNCLEMWVWAEYCSKSRENAWRFHTDALRDIQGLVNAHDDICKLIGHKNNVERMRVAVNKLAVEHLNLESVNANYTRVLQAAESVGLDDRFVPHNKFLSKFAHPTAALVIGLMHGEPRFRQGFQAICTVGGMYFMGECANALARMVVLTPEVG
jgi:hypothetical protein